MILRNELLVIVSFGAFFVGVICAIILVAFGNKNRFSNGLLSLGLLGLALIVLANTFTYSDILLNFPHVFRAIFPFHYLIPPIFYIYVRSTIRNEKRFLRYDWILFLPATLHLVEMTPYYLLSSDKKLTILQTLLETPANLVAHREGILPPFLHPLLKTLLGLLYTFLSIRLILRSKKGTLLSPKKQRLWRWLFLLTCELGLFYVIMLIVFTFNKDLPNLVAFANVPIMVVLFSTALTLLFRPSVLYGLHAERIQKEPKDQKMETHKDVTKFTLSGEQMLLYKIKLDTYFKEYRPFLKRNYRIHQLSADLDIPVHHLSLFINQEYGLSYSNFINRARIDHILSTHDSKRQKQLTLEGAAKEAGFNSRNTFIRAFKKYMGVTPSDFFLEREK